MSSQTESLRNALESNAFLRARHGGEKAYVTIVAESSPDPVAASILLSQHFIRSGVPFAIKFVDGLTHSNEMHLAAGPKILLGYVNQPFQKEGSDILRVSHYSSWADDTSSSPPINPCAFGLNGATVASTSTMVFKLLQSDSAFSPDAAGLAVAGAVSAQPVMDVDRLGALNREVLDDAVRTGKLSVVLGLKIPVAEKVALSVPLSTMLEPFVPGVSGDPQGSEALVHRIARRKSITKIAGIVAGAEARAMFEELSAARVRAGFSEFAETRIVGNIYLDEGIPLNTPLRNITGFATALEACTMMGRQALLFKLALKTDFRTVEEISKVTGEYCAEVAGGVRLILQSQDSYRETQNAVYLLAAKSITRAVALRIAKIICEHASFRGKPTVIVVHLDTRSLVVGSISTGNERAVDLGKTFSSAAARYRGSGFGIPTAAQALVPPESVEPFLDDVDVLLGGGS
jgi:hypothetical protein